MVKKLSKFMAVILGIVMCFALFAVAGCGDRDDEEKIYFDFTKISLNDDFYDNEIRVTFKNKESLKFKNYIPEDFPEVECIDVYMSKSFYSDTGYYKSDNEVKSAIESGELNKKEYHRTCSLTLNGHNKLAVLNGMAKLEKREEILQVNVIGVVSPISTYPNDESVANQWTIDRLKLDKAWDITTGSNTIKVGIIDTGIDGSYSD